jgi:hypothetical protein
LIYKPIINPLKQKFKGIMKKSSKFLKKPIDKFKRGSYNKDKFKGIELLNKQTSRCNGDFERMK